MSMFNINNFDLLEPFETLSSNDFEAFLSQIERVEQEQQQQQQQEEEEEEEEEEQQQQYQQSEENQEEYEEEEEERYQQLEESQEEEEEEQQQQLKERMREYQQAQQQQQHEENQHQQKEQGYLKRKERKRKPSLKKQEATLSLKESTKKRKRTSKKNVSKKPRLPPPPPSTSAYEKYKTQKIEKCLNDWLDQQIINQYDEEMDFVSNSSPRMNYYGQIDWYAKDVFRNNMKAIAYVYHFEGYRTYGNFEQWSKRVFAFINVENGKISIFRHTDTISLNV